MHASLHDKRETVETTLENIIIFRFPCTHTLTKSLNVIQKALISLWGKLNIKI